MKTIIKLIMVIILSSGIITLFAQQRRPLNVGDKAPELSVFKWIKGDPITHWKKDQYYMIEFGATWCTPCAAAIPELTSIQNEFKDQLNVVSLFVMERNEEPLTIQNPRYVTQVEKFITKRQDKISYSVGVDDPSFTLENVWLRSTGRNGVPHIFLLDETATIVWIGNSPKKAKEAFIALKENIKQLTPSSSINPKYDPTKLLLIGNNGGDENDFYFRSLLTAYDAKIKGNGIMFIEDISRLRGDSIFNHYVDRLEIIGAPITKLYYIAYSDTLSNRVPMRYKKQYADTLMKPYMKTTYGKYWHEPLLEVKDKTPFEFERKNTRNRYNYSLKVPKGTGTAWFIQQCFRRDMENYFGYHVTVETRNMPYWKLTAPDKSKAIAVLRSKHQSVHFDRTAEEKVLRFRNAVMFDIVSMLAMNFGYTELDYGKLPLSEQAAFFDETGITEKIDFDFDGNKSFEEIKMDLKKWGLELSKGSRPMKVVVIRD